jgi:1-acyl-sn-glycerol-3-phosphate acyltransferase
MMSLIPSILRLLASTIVTAIIAAFAFVSLPFNRKGKLYHRVGRFWSRQLLWICGVRVELHGAEHCAHGASVIYAANHASMVDIPVVIASVPDDIRLVYKKELEKIPLFGWGLKYGSYIGIDRGRGTEARKSLEEAVEKIQRGASVLLFVEGTRTPDGKLQPFKRGAFNLAVRSGVPVVPLTINGTYTIVPKHSLRIRPGTVHLHFAPPIRVEHADSEREAETLLMERVRSAMESHYVPQED